MHFPISNARRGARRGAPLIVHSHLRWDWVWQRPQQLVTRLAAHAPVLFVEEAVFADDVSDGALTITMPSPEVWRIVPRLPARLRDDYDVGVAHIRSMLLAELRTADGIGSQFADPVQWFYTPMPAPAMLGAFGEIGVVYDCMDELSQFRFAHSDLQRRERLLMEHANVVFAGGRKLCELKSQSHPNVHFFGCGVDRDHFAKALDPATRIAPELAALREPGVRIAGFYGVIDERLDYELIAELAECHSSLHVVMVGPTAKIDPADLPQHPNLHWLGPRPYDLLPNYVRGFDVCLMPFAINAATEYINPTKTLEYMAAGKPVVSTPVADVVRGFSNVVRVATNDASFIAGVLADCVNPCAERLRRGLEMAASSSWESVVASMTSLINESIAATSADGRRAARTEVLKPEATTAKRCTGAALAGTAAAS
jgi:glycosyltransferase involved in cell wall biosynthesis